MTKPRTFAVLAGIGLLVAVTLLVVLPALASPTGALVPPPSSQGITPVDVATGGQSNDCAIFNSSAANQFRIANPKTQTYATTVNGVPVTFKVTVNPADAQSSPAYANGKYLDFQSTGAAVVDVGIKGGTDETRYNYSGQVSGGGPNLGSVSSDGIMHAPAQTTDPNTGLPTQLYSVSNLTFCFDLAGSVSGKVFQDKNQNGTNDTGDSPLSWTVRLYKNGSVIATTSSSSSDGSYTFSVPFDTSATYGVCEVPAPGTWAQTKPAPNSANVCTGSGELPKGYTFKPTSSTQTISGDDFGNVPAVPCAQPMTSTLGDTQYDVQLAACKTGQTFVFNTGTTSSGNPFVSIWAGDQTLQNRQPMVEKIKVPNPLNADGSFKFTKLNYTDIFPFDPNATQPMPACKLDPRTDPASLILANGFIADSSKTSVLPTIGGTMATSCLISSSAFVDALGKAWFVAYVYSDIDGLRTST